jgi:hypothetical protein
LPGVAVDVVDVSPQGGIANPGPENPPFSGHDGTGGSETVQQMEQNLIQYARTYGSLGQAHLFVAPTSVQTQWAISSFPTIVFVGANGVIRTVSQGAFTIPQGLSEAEALFHVS